MTDQKQGDVSEYFRGVQCGYKDCAEVCRTISAALPDDPATTFCKDSLLALAGSFDKKAESVALLLATSFGGRQ